MKKFAVIDKAKCDTDECEQIPGNLDTPCFDKCKRKSIDIGCDGNGQIKAVIYTTEEDAEFYEVLPCNGCAECVPVCLLGAINMKGAS